MSYLFTPPPCTCLPVTGTTARYPVRRAYAVGKNYAAHVVEMGGDPNRDPPLIFLKAADSVGEWTTVAYPPGTSDLHYEGELVVALGEGAPPRTPADAVGRIYGYAAGIDFTRRDRQSVARKRGGPWDVAKSFTGAGPVSAIHPCPGALLAADTRLTLNLNDQKRQDAVVGQMIWDIPALILELGAVYDLAPGDLIFTGTPAGVGSVMPGDRLDVQVGDFARLSVTIAPSL
ncbi:MAG: fumarylacetoacetate hydrolase family protein [Rhodothalassiaceae bacterium]